MQLRHATILVLAGAVLTAPAYADQISDDISKAQTAYQEHRPDIALAALDAAAASLRQQRADLLKSLLPPPPANWTADPPETTAVGASTLGGGTSASRVYHLGGEQVQVQFTTDSPMLQQMAELADTQLGQSPEVETVMVNGQRATYTARDNGFMSLVGTVIVKVDGNPQVTKSTLRMFLDAIDFTTLQKLVR